MKDILLPMNTTIDDIKRLSVAERIQLVEDIWDSIATDAPQSLSLSEAATKELHRRAQAHQEDPSTSIPWEQVREKLFQHSS
jgi:putative addiction module component (TIGR02574 family)